MLIVYFLSSHYCCVFLTAYLFTYVFILIFIYKFKEVCFYIAIIYIVHIDVLNSSTSKIKRGEKWKTTCGITCAGKGTSNVNALCRL